MLLVALLRPLVALTLIAPAPAATVAREYVGVDAPEAAASEPAAAPEPAVVPEPPSTATPVSTPEPPSTTPLSTPEPVPTVEATRMEPGPAADVDTILEGPSEEEADLIPYDPMVDSPEAIRARHWIRSGIVFMVLGGALSIGGIAMAGADVNDPNTGDMSCTPGTDPAGNGCTEGGRRRAALAIGLPGAGLLAGGIAMLVVGKRQQKRLAAHLHADRRGFFIGAALRF